MRPIRIISLVAALAAGVAPLSPLPAVAERAQPVEGRESLFQRVLTRRGAVLLETPDGAEIESPPPFTAYYVYGEEGNYTRVGNRIEDGALGYVSTEELVPWNTAIVATFNNRAAQDRGRELLFDSEDALKAVLQDEDVSSAIAFLRERAAAGNAPEGSGVLSIEPEEFVDVEENLYIMPILEDKAYRLPGRHRGKALRVASMSATPPVEGLTDEERAALLKDFKVEIAFVIDTTKSMQPYIQETRTAIRDFATRLEESDITGKFSFAIVAFRDSTELRPELEYVTRKVLDFSDASGVEAFLASLDEVQATSVSSQGFSEDSLAGLHTAINDLDWDDAAAKMIFLVTDASPREENRSGEATDLLEAEMQVLAEDQQKAIFTWHLQRPGTEFDHAAGEAAYGELSRFGDVDTYTPIPLGDPSAFASALESTVERLRGIVEDAVNGELADAEEAAGGEPVDPATRIGFALQLAYLGQVTGATAPDVFEAWILQQDIPKFGTSALDIRILLTRNQLSTLTTTVETIMNDMVNTRLDPASFFSQLRTTLTLATQDGARLAEGPNAQLGDVVDDYLAGLPYTSVIMNMRETDWLSAGGGGQNDIIERLRSKLAAYREIDATASYWTPLTEGAPPGEHVAVIPLDLMP